MQCIWCHAKFKSVDLVQRDYRRVFNEDPQYKYKFFCKYEQFKETEGLNDRKRLGRPSVRDESVKLVRVSFAVSRNQFINVLGS